MSVGCDGDDEPLSAALSDSGSVSETEDEDMSQDFDNDSFNKQLEIILDKSRSNV